MVPTRLILWMMGVTLISGVAMTLFTGAPAYILAQRFHRNIDAEKERVLAAIDGHDTAALADCRLRFAEVPSQVELATYLRLLNDIKPWPIGPHMRTLLLFGLLPPFTWFMAATVENLVY